MLPRRAHLRRAALSAETVTAGATLLAAAVAFGPAPVRAQAVPPEWGALEFVGLVDWTPDALFDTLLTRAPDRGPSLFPVTLRELGFPRSRVERILVPVEVVDSVQIVRQVTLVTVVEPSHADALQVEGSFTGPLDLPASWVATDSLFRLNNPGFVAAAGIRLFRDADPALAENMRQGLGLPVQQERAREVWAALDELDSTVDLEEALTILREDEDASHRALAAAIVSGFPEDDRAWRGLSEALLDPSGRVTSLVTQVLGAMATAAPRPIDWTDSSEALRMLLTGANLAALPTVLQTLVSTEVSPDLAGALLAENGHLVLGHLGSQYSPHRAVAQRFLAQIRGQDLGSTVDPWREWVEGI